MAEGLKPPEEDDKEGENMMRSVEPKQLRALLVSDAHVNGVQLNLLAQWLKTVKPQYDVALVAGNMSSMVNAQRKDPASEYQATNQLVDALTFLKKHVQRLVIYVPGNTEPSATYTCELDVSCATNAHKQAVQLGEGLVLVGLGGALPVQKDGKERLEGYPYKKEEDYAHELDNCLETAMKTFGPETDYILLTHMGPMDSTTTDAYFGAEKLKVGSKSQGEALSKYASSLLCNIHGHSAAGEGLTKPYTSGLSVINPGGLTNGKFGEMTLTRGLSGKWKVSEVNFRNLDTMS